jgi:threonine synthase
MSGAAACHTAGSVHSAAMTTTPTFPRAHDTGRQWRGLIEEYRDRLPVSETTPVVTLREGGTPLIHSEALSERTGCDVWLKFEGANPTGSFKDRGMTLAISKAVEAGAQAVICASTGNTSASAAAYAAKAGLVCGVLIPKGKIALGKLAQALIHGAKVIQVDGNFDMALEICRTLDEKYPVELVNSVNPFRIQGQKTGAFEVCDFLGRAPTSTSCRSATPATSPPTGAATASTPTDGVIDRLPVMRGYQAAGAAPIVEGRRVERRRRSPRRSASATRPRGTPRSPPRTSPAGRSAPSPTGTSSGLPPGRERGRVLRDGLGRLDRRPAPARRRRRAARRRHRRVHPHRQRAQGARLGHRRRRQAPPVIPPTSTPPPSCSASRS